MRLAAIRHADIPVSTIDLLAKLGVGTFYFASILSIAADFPALDDSFDLHTAMRLASSVAILMLNSLICLSIVLRGRAVAKARGILPRIDALTGAFASLSLPFLPWHDLGLGMDLLSIALVLAGGAGGAYAMLHLRSSFSLMAEARVMVTTGPYARVRHPLYLFEQMAVIGALCKFASWAGLAIILLQMGFQWRRILNEERVLAGTFPAYADYMARTPRFIPSWHSRAGEDEILEPGR